VSESIYHELQGWFKGQGGRIIIDECQKMLRIFALDYCSSVKGGNAITNGTFDSPRSYFSLIARFVIKNNFKSVWCGTQMGIRNMDLLESTAGGKSELKGIHVFTGFNYLEPDHIFQLLKKWINADATEHEKLFKKIAFMLQGRPRFFASVLHELTNVRDMNGFKMKFDDYILTMITDVNL
jgi:hypothetical protein